MCLCPRLAAFQRGHQSGARRQLADKHTEASQRERAAVQIAQVDVVKPAEVGLYRIAMLSEQTKEAYQFPVSPRILALSSR